ncbi:MAG: agmatinase [Planctomycetes bacterium]|nr:agmatinase [Planctomycetota bacterium]NOG55369.1 agmatinase [Planctomycetota bacterium]
MTGTHYETGSDPFSPTFLGLEGRDADPQHAAAVVIPVPYDLTSSWVKGADRGPAALIDASQYVELYDTETDSQAYRHGIATRKPISCTDGPEQLAELVTQAVTTELDADRLPIVIGGEHSVTIGAVQAAAKRHAALSVLQIDAHADTREEYHGSPYNHACVMARVREVCPIVQVGIRSVDPSELPALDRSRVFFAHQIAGRPDRAAWIDRAVSLLTDTVYVTIDLDAFDPSIIPATGTPEPGGLNWYEITALLDALVASGKRVIGFDVVELCPADPPATGDHASAFTAAKLVYRFWSAITREQPE